MRLIVAVGLILCAACGGAPDDMLVITDVTVIPMRGDEVLPGRNVTVRDGRIEAIEPADGAAVPAWATLIDGRGKYLIPGLFDTHVHLNDAESLEHLSMYLAAGVTTVQSMHGRPEFLELRESIARGERSAPRLLTTGPTTARARVDTPDKAARLVREQKRAGYDAVKMYGDGNDGMTLETYARLIEVAREEGIRVVGHAPRNMPFTVVLEEGQDSIDHMEEVVYTHRPLVDVLSPMIDVQFGRVELDEEMKARIAAFPGVDERIDAELLGEFAGQVARAGIAVTPTLVAFETIWRQTTEDYPALLADERMRYVSPLTRIDWGPERNRYRTGWADRMDTVRTILFHGLELQKRLVAALHEAGVPIMTGTDAPLTFVYPGFALHRELELLVDAGLSEHDALRAATIVPAGELGLAAETGSIEPGKVADLVLLERNPLDDIRNVAAVHGIVLRGEWLDAPGLDERLDALAASYQPLSEAIEALAAPIASGDAAELARTYRALDSDDPALAEFVESTINERGYALLNDGEVEAAIEVFTVNTEQFPGSANAWDSLGEGYLHAGRPERSFECYERALSEDADYANARRMIDWVRPALDATGSARPDLEPDELRRIVGDYGPRQVRYADGRLVYNREGNPEYELRALAHDLFALEGLPTFRLRFERGDEPASDRLVGLYVDGRTDESPRSDSD